MIINVRGTHGSGKSTLVRRVMEHYKYREPIMLEGRRQPIGYVCRDKKTPHLCTNVLFVAGHYESAGGGCDNIPKVDLMFRMIRRYAKLGYHVIYEGILAQHSTDNALRLHRKYKFRVIVMDTPLKKAIRGVRKRRRQRGNTKPFDPKNVIKEQRSVHNAVRRLSEHGLHVRSFTSRSKALQRVTHLLRIP
jgi:ABC-type multidrug transport system ATPase subunit